MGIRSACRSMRVVNVVATRSLGSPIDLRLIQKALPGSRFAEKGAKWLMYRFGEKNRYFAFYSSGKFLITGAVTLDELENESMQIIRKLRKAGLSVHPGGIMIHNIVVEDEVESEIQLEDIYPMLDSSKTSFEPEQFPGLIYRDWGVSVLLFSTGKFIVAGIKKWEDIDKVVGDFRRLIYSNTN
jgi:transcription initiation factor TFIID TATA-box-binding protein